MIHNKKIHKVTNNTLKVAIKDSNVYIILQNSDLKLKKLP